MPTPEPGSRNKALAGVGKRRRYASPRSCLPVYVKLPRIPADNPKVRCPTLLTTVLLAVALPTASLASTLPSAIQARVDEHIKLATAWATEPAIVEATVAHNLSLPPAHAAIDQDKWRALPARDPLVAEFIRNPAGQLLATKRSPLVIEAFLSDASGLKIAFLSKPTNWSHRGKPKHDVPMTGQVWQGPIEIDESSGYKQLQIAVPVFDREKKPIGSLVVGLNISELIQ